MSSTSISEYTRMDINIPVFREGTWDSGIWEEARNYPVYNFDGKTIIDLGAHIGGFTTKAAESGAKMVYAYEAWRENFEVLKKNVEGYDNVKANNLAVWKSRSPVKNVYFHDDFDLTNTGGVGVFEGSGLGLEVKTVGLDDVLTQSGPVDIVKIDIESGEYPALYTSRMLGMVRSIVGEYHHGMIDHSCEIDGVTYGYNIEDLKSYLELNGFCVAVEAHDEDVGNFAAFRL